MKLPTESDHLPPGVRQADIDGEDERVDVMFHEDYWLNAERLSDR